MLALLALATAVASTSLFSGILCVGDDGHVAIELARAGRCADGEAAADLPAALGTPSVLATPLPGGDCGPCTDVGVASGARLQAAKPPQADPAPALTAFPVGAVWQRSAAARWVLHPDRAPAARSALRGTILRC
jgi:hypothetical protein